MQNLGASDEQQQESGRGRKKGGDRGYNWENGKTRDQSTEVVRSGCVRRKFGAEGCGGGGGSGEKEDAGRGTRRQKNNSTECGGGGETGGAAVVGRNRGSERDRAGGKNKQGGTG